MSARKVYLFGNSKPDGNGTINQLLGGKGTSLPPNVPIGLPVPPGLIGSTEVCAYYLSNKNHCPPMVNAQVKNGIARIDNGPQIPRHLHHVEEKCKPISVQYKR